MPKRIFPLVLSILLTLAAASPISAAAISSASGQLASASALTRGVIVVSSKKAEFYVVHPSRGNEPNSAPEAAVYGPFLGGKLAGKTGSGLLDVEITGDGKTALFSNYPDQILFFVDITQALAPQLKGQLTLSFEPEDIAITADNRYALVTGNGGANPIALIDIQNRTLVEEFTLPNDNSIPTSPKMRYAQAVVTAPNGTVVVVDYPQGKVYTLLIDNTGHLSFKNSYSYFIKTDGTVSETQADGFQKPTPINVALAPDGQTLLILDTKYYSVEYTDPKQFDVGVFQLTGPGELKFKGAVTGLTRAPQSAAFDASGEKAYLMGNNGGRFVASGGADVETDKISLLKITAPGVVSLEQAAFADLNRQSGNQLFGIDTLSTQEDLIVAGFSTLCEFTDECHLSIIDGISQKVKYISDLGIIAGVKTIPPLKVFLPVITRE